MKAQHSITQIATLISGSHGYNPKQASGLVIERSVQCRNASTLVSRVKEQANAMLRLQCSSELVVSSLPVRRRLFHQNLCADKTQGRTLWKSLRRQKQKIQRCASGPDRRAQVPNRRHLSERPAHDEARSLVGHWGCDTVIGANHKKAIGAVVERKSGYTIMVKVASQIADLVDQAIIKALTPLEASVNMLTHLNSPEFCSHELIEAALKSTSYIVRPCAIWEREPNESFNGLLLQYVTKKCQLKNNGAEEIKIMAIRLNNRSRKRLGSRTSAAVFHQSLSSVALRA